MNSENSGQKQISTVVSSSNEITLKELVLKIRDLYQYLMTKWIMILIICIVGSSLGFLYSYFKKPVYTASTTFVLEEGEGGGGGLGQYAGLASMVGVDLKGGGGGLFQGDNIMELYKSRTMVRNALLSQVFFNGKKQMLVDRFIEINNFRNTWNKNPTLKNIHFNIPSGTQFSRTQDSLLGAFASEINKNFLSVSKPDKKLSIIRVDVKSKDELFAKLFNDEIVRNVNDFYIKTKTKKSLSNLAILQHQTDSVRNILNGAIYTSVAVTDATPNLNPTRLILRASAQRSQFNAEANKAILTQLVQNLELSKMSLRRETPLIQVIDEPILPLNMEKMGKLKGIVFGGIIAGFLGVFFLAIRRIFIGIIE